MGMGDFCMRWRNVQMFGWKSFRPPFSVVIIGLLVIIAVISAAYWMSLGTKVPNPPAVQQIIQPVQAEAVENESVMPAVEDDTEFYTVNTFFYSSDCVFEYRRLI